MVRMGKNPKGWSTNARKQEKKSSHKRPSRSSLGLQVGRVSPNLIISVYWPLLMDMAVKNSEDYASLAVKNNNTESGSTSDTNAGIGESSSPSSTPRYLFTNQERIDEFFELLHETSRDFFTTSQWKVSANAAKFERQLDEKYGFFLPLIKRYPESEVYMRKMQRHLASGAFHPLRRGEGPLSKTASVILLFMMHRNGVRQDAVFLTGLFLLVGLQPWALILVVSLSKIYFDGRRRRKPVKFPRKFVRVEKFYETQEDALLKLEMPVGQTMPNDDKCCEEEYDCIVLGTGISALYSAAILSRCGKKTLLLSNDECATGTLTPLPSIPFDINPTRITDLQDGLVQSLLLPALATTSDPQGGIRFTLAGTSATGHAHQILQFHGMEDPFVLRPTGVASDANLLYNVDLPSQFHEMCHLLHSSSPQHFVKKMVPVPGRDTAVNSVKENQFGEAAVRPAKPFLDKIFAEQEVLGHLYASIGMGDEELPMEKLSFGTLLAHVSNSEHTVHYPVGGTRALGHALANVIQGCGGTVVTKAAIAELLLEDEQKNVNNKNAENAKNEKIACIGVKTKGGQSYLLKNKGQKGACIISHLGFIDTFYKTFPETIRDTYGVPSKLWTLTERRPHFKILLLLHGTKEELDISDLDYKRCPYLMEEAPPDTANTSNITTNTSSQTTDVNSTTGTEGISRDKRGNYNKREPPSHKYITGNSYIHISFPSAKDPTWKKRHPTISTCVITIEADDDFVKLLHTTQPKLYVKQNYNESHKKNLFQKVLKDLYGIYPTLQTKVKQTILYGPLSMGLSHTPERFACPGIHCGPFYQNLYCGGKDVTLDTFAADLAGGWMAVNAALGYNYIDHAYLERNVTRDLNRFMDYPNDGVEEEAFPIGEEGGLEQMTREEAKVEGVVMDDTKKEN